MNQPSAKPTDYAVVVSFAKSGTNLISNLMRQQGYKCVGHGIRESYAELAEKLISQTGGAGTGAQGISRTAAAEGFSRSDRMMRVLKLYPARTCLFVHRMHIGPHLLEWCATREPRFFFHYREPRDLLVSMINYLLLKAKEQFTEAPWNAVYARILAQLPDFDRQLEFAIQHMEAPIERYREHTWLLHHPGVCKTSYEELVGTRGGGDAESQERAISRVVEHLGGEVRKEHGGDGLYDTGSRTFFRGRIGTWREVFKDSHASKFLSKYSDVLETYGYG